MDSQMISSLHEKGAPLVAQNPKPIILDDPGVVYRLESGGADIFAVPLKDGQVAARRRYLFSLQEGGVVFPPPNPDFEVGWVILPAPGARFTKFAKSLLGEYADEANRADLAKLLDPWIAGMLSSLSESRPPKDAGELGPGERATLAAGATVGAGHGVVWVECRGGAAHLLGRADLGTFEAGCFPIHERTWFSAADELQATGYAMESWLGRGAGWQTELDAFHRVAQRFLVDHWNQERAKESAALDAKAASEKRMMQKSVTELSAVIDLEGYRREKLLLEDEDALLTAFRLVGDAMGIQFVQHPNALRGIPSKDPVGDIVRASGVRAREVILSGTWWRQDNGPLLAFVEEGEQPVALLPVSPRRYELHNPQDGTSVVVDEKVAGRLKPFGWMFYKPFPRRALGVKDILAFGLSSVSRKDLFNVVTLGLAGGLLGIVTPVAIGILFSNIIPEMDRSQLFYVTVILVGSALATFFFGITQAVAMLRIETKMQTSIQASVWDRLLSLSVPFFRRFSAGDLSHRALSIHAISQMISGAAMGTILSSVFSFFSLLLLFYYDVRLALMSLAMVVAALSVTVAFGYYQVRYQRTLMDIEGRTLSLVLQLVNGIAKFRVAGAEGRAFNLWSKLFKELRQVTYRSRLNEIFLSLFNTMLPILTSAVLFVAVVGAAEGGISAGNFIAFTAAFSSFLGAMIAMSSIAITVLNLFPLFERAKPIFESLPEVDEARQDPGELTGDIEVSRLCFRYDADGPLILDNISLHMKPGEFVAVVGSSGSGKSTLFRCLLGFEAWESGMIFYDGQSLDSVDIRSVRKQMGVVLQSGKLMAADIFTNICGSSSVNTVADAWAAAEGAGLAEDIRQMPMGMHTFINEGATTISGGQRQRLLIARAIVNKPRILLFDEATSALDNQTQAVVSRTLDGLHATRVVIAHRLSTIRNADRIYVLDKGKVVQVGTYDELVNQEGLFAELAKRQLA